MSETIDELTINWEDNGELKIKEIKKHVLSRGAWATIMFLYLEMDMKTKEYKGPKIAIRRYKKRGGKYVYQSKFNISSVAQGLELARMINEWFKDEKKDEKDQE